MCDQLKGRGELSPQTDVIALRTGWRDRMCNHARVTGRCECGAIEWTAPMTDASAACDCHICAETSPEWASCETNDFDIVKVSAPVVGHQAGPFSPRHYHCGSCNSPVWTWTADTKRRREGLAGMSDYENPILNWNVRLATDEEGAPVRRASTETIAA